MAATELLTSDTIRQGGSQQTIKATKDEAPKVRDAKKKLDDMGFTYFESDILTIYREIGHTASVEAIVAEITSRTYQLLHQFDTPGVQTMDSTQDGITRDFLAFLHVPRSAHTLLVSSCRLDKTVMCEWR